ncbi:MAG: YceI family protein [Bdellovibrionales bacterium]|nr:YceI family protein [Bdellovibrionales bacterium]NQZ19684.1 YceI family protein [Bdellovibrionales bacterium]
MKALVFLGTLVFALSTWATEVDSAKSEFKWLGTKVTGKHFGKVPLKSSKVTVDKKKNITGGEFVLDLNNFTVDDLEGEWEKKFVTHIKSADFFEIKKWPTAKLVINKLDGKMAHGKLTIKDKTNDVKFPYKKEGKKYSGKLKFDRTKYGMIYGSGNFFKNLGDKMIHNDVTVDFTVQLK